MMMYMILHFTLAFGEGALLLVGWLVGLYPLPPPLPKEEQRGWRGEEFRNFGGGISI